MEQRGERKGWSLVYIHNSYYSLLFSRDRGVVIKRTPITLPIQLYYGARLMGPSKLSYRFIALIYRDSVICKHALVSRLFGPSMHARVRETPRIIRDTLEACKG